MILCDHCNKVVRRGDHCVDQGQRNLRRTCLVHLNAAHLIMDYVAICEKRGHLLEFEEFIPLWMAANEIAEAAAPVLQPPNSESEKKRRF